VLSFGSRLLVLAVVVPALGCARPVDLFNTDRPESDLAALVDSEAARRLLADLRARRPPDPSSLHANGGADSGDPHARRLPDRRELRELGREVSMDFAALFFAQALLADPASREIQATFERFLREGPDLCATALQRPRAFPYTVLFAPSWLYRSHPRIGSDFAEQRRILDRVGIPNRFIAVGESDSVEDNAALIVDAIRAAAREQSRVILVSVSKSGAESALALSRLTPDETAGVAAWVNLAGALRGTPLADATLLPPVRWLARGLFWLNDWGWAGVTSLATEPSRRRLAGVHVPRTITVVNLVAIPVSGSVGPRVYPAYLINNFHGPSDGLVPLADTVWPGGINLVALGADHLFTLWREDSYVLALLRAVDVAVRRDGPRPDRAPGGSSSWRVARGAEEHERVSAQSYRPTIFSGRTH
jgi:hypothetical protein